MPPPQILFVCYRNAGKREDWSLPGGSGYDLQTVQAQRDALGERLTNLVAS